MMMSRRHHATSFTPIRCRFEGEDVRNEHVERIAALMRDRRLIPDERTVGCDILMRLTAGAAVFAVRDIVKANHLNERKVRSATTRLEDLGHLMVRRRLGTKSRYSISIKGCPTTSTLVEPVA
jgi:hypothetical protein